MVKFSLLLFLVLFVSCSSNDNPSDSNNVKKVGLLVGDLAPNFTTSDIHGNSVDLNSLRGNVVLIDFWATWCGPCKQSMPEIIDIWSEFKSDKFKIIGVSFDHDAVALNKYIIDNNLTWTHIHDTKNDVNSNYEVVAIPHTYLISKKGEIIFANHPLSTDLKKLVREELGK